MIERSEEYEKIGRNLIRRNKEFRDIIDFDIRIAFLVSDEEKTSGRKIICGECIKVAKNYFWCCPYDFMIIVYEPNTIHMNEKQKRILIRHELKHIGVNTGGNEPCFYIVPHDIEDFRSIIKRYGIDWSR